MKSIVILYECNSKYATEKSFDELSAKEMCSAAVEKLNSSKVVRIRGCENVTGLLREMKNACTENQADYVIFSYDDLPFYNTLLTGKLIGAHEEYKAEYTYADGYPYGFAPEIIDQGTLGILLQLSETSLKGEGEKAVSRECIYNLLKREINSFEVEAVLADEDWRLLRLAFHCGKKENFLSCVALFDEVIGEGGAGEGSCDGGEGEFSADKLSEIASRTPGLLKTVPGFYNIQISDFVSFDGIYTPYNKAYEEKHKLSPMKSNKVMSFDDFSGLVDRIGEFSDTAVVSLSAWGEAFAHKDILKMIEKVLSYEGLSVYVETDGYNITDELCEKLAEIVNNAGPRTNGWDKFMIAVSLDAISNPKYKAIHKGCDDNGFEKALAAISKLTAILPNSVYPQFVRMNDNEDELEGFFRYWSEDSNGTGGNFIIQKYDDFGGELPDRKPADLAPIERMPCWHIRRDLTILSNGDVPLCRSYVFSNIVGNVFNQSLEEVWGKLNNTLIEHINKTYNEKCGKCDEYYTFNF